jgi:hypothetical protein
VAEPPLFRREAPPRTGMPVDGQSRNTTAWVANQLPGCPSCCHEELRTATPNEWHSTASCASCGTWWDMHRIWHGIGLLNGEARVWRHDLGWVHPGPEETIPRSPGIRWQAVLETMRDQPPVGAELLAGGVRCVPAYWAVQIARRNKP